jgi:hypothetical protein
MDLSSAFDTNVGVHSFERKMALVSSLTRSVTFSFLTVGAGFMLSKAKLFPTEAARGGAQIVLVRRLLVIIRRPTTVFDSCCEPADQDLFVLIEYCLAVPLVLPYCSCVYSAEHQFVGSIDRCRSALWGGRWDDGLDHQALFLGASPI